jgi:SOS-response transcriptional repressor LexA
MISKLETGQSTETARLVDLAIACTVRPEWLATGRGPMTSQDANTLQSSGSVRWPSKVPLISWIKAGKFSEVIDHHAPGVADEWIDTTVPLRAGTFALRVEGDSMEPEFPTGTVIIVEPELDHRSGDYVVVRNGDNEATFKQLVKDGADWFLKPLNPRYPIKPLTSRDVICGVVRAAEKRYR